MEVLLIGAAAKPVDMPRLVIDIKTELGKKRHMRQMDEQSVEIPTAFLVTFSIETGHGVGPCRHMSMSVMRPGRIPSQEAVWMVAQELGFVGDLSACDVYPEDLLRGDSRAITINVLQPISVAQPHAG